MRFIAIERLCLSKFKTFILFVITFCSTGLLKGQDSTELKARFQKIALANQLTVPFPKAYSPSKASLSSPNINDTNTLFKSKYNSSSKTTSERIAKNTPQENQINEQSNICFDSSFTKLLGITNNTAYVQRMIHTSDDGILIGGSTYDTTTGLHSSWRTNGYLLKADNMGNKEWVKEIYDAAPDTPSLLTINKVFELSTKEIIVVGSIDTGFNDNHLANYVMKLSSSGNLIWYKCFYSKLITNVNGWYVSLENLTEGLNGDLILCGTTYSRISGYRYETVVKLNSQGDLIWDRNFWSSKYSIGAEGINVFMQNGNILETGITYGDGYYNQSAVNFFTIDYNTGAVLQKKYLGADYEDQTRRFNKSFTAFYNNCTRIESNGHFIVSGDLFSNVATLKDTIDYFGIIDLDSSLNITDAYTISAEHSILYPWSLIQFDKQEKALFSFTVPVSGGQYIPGMYLNPNDVYIGSIQKKTIYKERKISYDDRIALNGTNELCYLDDGSYMYAQSHDTEINENRFLDYIELKKLHDSDTSSDCLGHDTLFTSILPLQVSYNNGHYVEIDSVFKDQLFEVKYNINILDTLTTNSMNPCDQKSSCDTLKIHGNSRICGNNQSFFYTAYKSKTCGSFVAWDIDTSAVSNVNVITDSSISITYKNKNWQGNVYASLSGGHCSTAIIDSLPVSITSVKQNLNLGADTVLCSNNTLYLHAGSGFAFYIWQDGSKDSIFEVTKPGVYSVRVGDNCQNDYSDSVIVTAAHYPFNAGNDTIKCNNDTITLTATSGFINYKWYSTYSINDSTKQTIQVYPQITTNYIASAEKFPGCFVRDTIHVSVLHSDPVSLGKDTSLCVGQFLYLNASGSFSSYLWNTGQTTQTITTTQKGTYNVRATASNGCSSYDTLAILNVTSLPDFSLGKDTTLCTGNQLAYSFSLQNTSYLWNNGSTLHNQIINQPGNYWLAITQHGCTNTDTVEVKFQPSPIVSLGKDTVICEGTTKLLDATNPNATYQWQDDSSSPQYLVKYAGLYYVKTSINGCSASDSTTITYTPKPVFNLGKDIFLCNGSALLLTPSINTAVNYMWQDGSTSPSYEIKESGIYTLTATNVCGSLKDSIQIISEVCKLNMPSAFTPNKDGNNDIFKVKYPIPVKQFYMMIYSRWGQKVFESSEIAKGWNGTGNGVDQDPGTYIWTISLVDTEGIKQTAQGTVTLIR